GVETGTPAAFGFAGELQQGGLVYLRARWYNAASGTFTSRDSFAGFAQTPYSLHPYQYGYSNPVRYGDPSGRWCVDLEGTDYDFGTTCDPTDPEEETGGDGGGGGGSGWDDPTGAGGTGVVGGSGSVGELPVVTSPNPYDRIWPEPIPPRL